ALTPGQTLKIPSTVTAANRSDTFKPYNAQKLIGETTPELPPPPPPPQPGRGGCGGIAQIVMIVVAVVVTVYTAGAASGALSAANATFGSVMQAGAAAMTSNIGIAMGAAAVGNVASQAVGVAMGVQDSINWKGVATASLSAGVTAGIGASGLGDAIKGLGYGKTATTMLTAAASSTISQGILSAAGLGSFSWRNVAAAAIAAPVTQSISEGIFGTVGANGVSGVSDLASSSPLAARVINGLASGVVNQVAQIAVNGKGKLDMAQIATNAFGDAIANELVLRAELSTVADQYADVYGQARRAGALPQQAASVALNAEQQRWMESLLQMRPNLEGGRKVAQFGQPEFSMMAMGGSSENRPIGKNGLLVLTDDDGLPTGIGGVSPKQMERARLSMLLEARKALSAQTHEWLDTKLREDAIYDSLSLIDKARVGVGGAMNGLYNTIVDTSKSVWDLVTHPEKLEGLPGKLVGMYQTVAPLVEQLRTDADFRKVVYNLGESYLATRPKAELGAWGAGGAAQIGLMLMTAGASAEAQGAEAAVGFLRELGAGERAASIVAMGSKVGKVINALQGLATINDLASMFSSASAQPTMYSGEGDGARAMEVAFQLKPGQQAWRILSKTHLKKLDLELDWAIKISLPGPTKEMFANAYDKASGMFKYINPATNKLEYIGRDAVSVDHIFPVSKILSLDNVNKLTPNQLEEVLSHGPNLQVLPKWINSSKGDLLGNAWSSFPETKGSPTRMQINPAYQRDLLRQQMDMQRQLQDLINSKLGLGKA
ncbi:hypothetical protein, partial [Parachitinimonas caeni]